VLGFKVMTPFALSSYSATFCLIAASWWIDVAKCKDFSRGIWRWILSALGLLLISVSFALYIVMLARLLRNPEVARNTDALLPLVRTYTRFYPTSFGLVGAALGLFGRGASRWTSVAAGILVSLWWSLFGVSLL
jgi:hypothetical protein